MIILWFLGFDCALYSLESHTRSCTVSLGTDIYHCQLSSITPSSPCTIIVSNHINLPKLDPSSINTTNMHPICYQPTKSSAHVLPKHFFPIPTFRTNGSLPSSLKSGLKSPRSPKSPKSVPWIEILLQKSWLKNNLTNSSVFFFLFFGVWGGGMKQKKHDSTIFILYLLYYLLLRNVWKQLFSSRVNS